MTRLEAIEIMKRIKQLDEISKTIKDFCESLDKGIEALENIPVIRIRKSGKK